LLGLNREEIINALSLAWVDGQSLRTYRHSPNTGSRKSWAAGDATSRGVRLALMAAKGEMGYPSVLSAPTWGFYDVLFKGKEFKFQRPYGSYVMEHILFKISFPAEFHAQTAAECAMALHPQVKDRIADIRRSPFRTHQSAIRIIDKKGPLSNPADRDHCIQYMSRCRSFSAADRARLRGCGGRRSAHRRPARQDGVRRRQGFQPRLPRPGQALHRQRDHGGIQGRQKNRRSRRRISDRAPPPRIDGIPLLVEKFKTNLARRFPERQRAAILALCQDAKRLETTPVNEFVDLFVI